MAKLELKTEKVFLTFDLEDADKVNDLFASGEWCRPKYDDMKHKIIMIRRRDKLVI